MFCENKASLVGFCFFIRDYKTICQLFEEASLEETVDSRLMKSLVKVGNLLLNSSMHQLFADMNGTYDIKNRQMPNQFIARKAYLSLLMFLPINKATRPLKLKVEEGAKAVRKEQ